MLADDTAVRVFDHKSNKERVATFKTLSDGFWMGDAMKLLVGPFHNFEIAVMEWQNLDGRKGEAVHHVVNGHIAMIATFLYHSFQEATVTEIEVRR